MTIYLRNEENETILDLEVWVKTEDSISFCELRSVIDIKNYSLMLLDTSQKVQAELIADFDQISELRGWLWETYFMGRKNEEKEIDGVIGQLKMILKKVADKYGLYLVTD